MLLRASVLLVLKIGVALLLVWWAHRQPWFVVPSALHLRADRLTLLTLGGIGLLALLVMGLSAWQLRMLLAQDGLAFTAFETQGVILMAALFEKLVPGPLGSEGIKALYLCRHVPRRRPDVFAVLATDHAVHDLGKGLLRLAVLPILLAWGVLPFVQHGLRYVPWAIGLLLVLGLVGYTQRRRLAAAARALFARAPRPVHRFVDGLRRFLHAPRLLALCTGLSIAWQLLSWTGLLCGNLLIPGPLPLLERYAVATVLQHIVQLPLHLLGGSLAFLLMRFSPDVAETDAQLTDVR